MHMHMQTLYSMHIFYSMQMHILYAMQMHILYFKDMDMRMHMRTRTICSTLVYINPSYIGFVYEMVVKRIYCNSSSQKPWGKYCKGLHIKFPLLLCAGCPVCRKSTEADTPAGVPSQDTSTGSAAVEAGAAEAGQPGGAAPAS